MRKFEKIYVNDFDGNILNAPTIYYFEEQQLDGSWKEIEVLAHDHDSNPEKYINNPKYRFIDNDPNTTYQNTKDYFDSDKHKWPYGMLQDVNAAIENRDFAPSFEKFKKEVLIGAELFAILTARWSWVDTLKHNIKRISETVLSQEEKEQQIENIKKKYGREKDADYIALRKYFDVNVYLPVNNIEISKFLYMWNDTSADKKVKGMIWYMRYVSDFIAKYQSIDQDQKIKIWFSDDWFDNMYAMLDFFAAIYNRRQRNYIPDYPKDYLDYRLYYTWNIGKDILAGNIQRMMDRYARVSIVQEDKSYVSTDGIWMPTTKISITKK
jgi:hypothetical protein